MHPAPTGPSTLTASELMHRIAQDDAPTNIDVRSAAEFESAHIRGSYNVPLPLLSEHSRDLAERLDGHVVLVCQSGVRAEDAHRRLASVGLGSAAILSGGISAYDAAGGAVVRGVQRWAMERQVRMTAGSLVLVGSVGGLFVAPWMGYLSAAVGAGLTYSALSNSCAMAAVLSKMPWNSTAAQPTFDSAIRTIPSARS